MRVGLVEIGLRTAFEVVAGGVVTGRVGRVGSGVEGCLKLI